MLLERLNDLYCTDHVTVHGRVLSREAMNAVQENVISVHLMRLRTNITLSL